MIPPTRFDLVEEIQRMRTNARAGGRYFAEPQRPEVGLFDVEPHPQTARILHGDERRSGCDPLALLHVVRDDDSIERAEHARLR